MSSTSSVDSPGSSSVSKSSLGSGPYVSSQVSHGAMESGRRSKNSNEGKKTFWFSLGLSDATTTTAGYIFRHPWTRLLVACGLIFLNFGIYAEDPVAHAHTEANIPIIGHDIAFVFAKYPTDEPAYVVLKVVMWMLGILTGCAIGRLCFHHFLLQRTLRLKMFQGDKGTWMVMFLATLPVLAGFSLLYSAMLPSDLAQYRIESGAMTIKDTDFMKVAAVGTWLGDFITAFMVIDMMLQDGQFYPNWAKGLRRWWGGHDGKNRIVTFWVVAIGSTAIVVSAISTDFIDWDDFNNNWLPTNELSRAVLAGVITLLDLMVVMQDWEFPYFTNPFDIKLPGLPVTEIKFLERFKHFEIHITGKWFNYGIIFIVMLLDLNMLKNQIIYEPATFGQYVGPHDHIFTVEDTAWIAAAKLNKTMLTYEARRGFDDDKMNAKWKDFPYAVKLLGVLPVLFAFFMFIYLLSWGRKVKKGDTAQHTTAGMDEEWSATHRSDSMSSAMVSYDSDSSSSNSSNVSTGSSEYDASSSESESSS